MKSEPKILVYNLVTYHGSNKKFTSKRDNWKCHVSGPFALPH